MFLILAAYGLRRDQQAERDRLRAAGARTGQLVVFSLAEAAWLAGVAVVAGAAVGALAPRRCWPPTRGCPPARCCPTAC